MRGLSASRHAPHGAPRRNSIPRTTITHQPSPPPPLTITPVAPTGNPAPRSPSASSSPRRSHHHHHPHHPAAAASASAKNKHDLARYAKIVRRLQWKLPFLAAGYHQAVHRVGTDPATVAEAELMFKLDFFEYYMLIERALVHLLGVFGVEIPRGVSPPHAIAEGKKYGYDDGDNMNGSGRGKGLAASVWKEGQRHRYHANVLAALDREDNPLHGTLGTGEVRRQLGRAKDLRNRWKTAGDEDEDRDEQGQNGAGREREWQTTRKIAAPLETYNLEKMLEVIFEGLEAAFRVAERFVCGDAEQGGEGDTEMLVDWGAVGDGEDQWEFMVDAMDWEAV